MNRLRIIFYSVLVVSTAPCFVSAAGQNGRPSLGSFVPDDAANIAVQSGTSGVPIGNGTARVDGDNKKSVEPSLQVPTGEGIGVKPAIISQNGIPAEAAPVSNGTQVSGVSTDSTIKTATAEGVGVSPTAISQTNIPQEVVAAPSDIRVETESAKVVLPEDQVPATPQEVAPIIKKAEVIDPEILEKGDEVTSDEDAKSIFEPSEADSREFFVDELIQPGKKEPIIVIKKNEKLSKFIEKIAAKRGFNVILPHGADLIKETITFDTAQKLPLSEAMAYLYMFLNMTGYRVRPDNGFFIVSKVTEQNLSREPLPFFVNVPPERLPKTDVQIRAIYYLANFRVPVEVGGNDPLNLILKDMLGSSKFYLFDRKTNAVIMIASARKIAAVMKLILNLDETGHPDDLQVIPLYNAPAPAVAKLFNEQIIASAQDARRSLRNDPMAQEDFYFAPNTHIVADPRTNSLIVLGQAPAVQRIRDLIKDYIDLPPESGRSILHVYDLQYLKSRDLAEQLTKIVSGGDSEQSRKETGGPQKFFEEVKIIPEEIEDAPTVGSGSKITTRSTIGGNRLVIAATNDDWLQIRSLIEQLDKPDYQVILEVMIVDLTVSASKALKSQTRNPNSLNLPAGFQFQTAQMTQQILDSSTDPTTLAADLLRLIDGKSIAQSQTAGDDMGAMIISLKDPNTDGIWSVLELLDKWAERKVLSHPFFVTKNNYAAYESSDEVRRNLGALAENNSTVTTIKYNDYKATLRVDITPRISSVDRLNMQVKVKVDNFVDATGENKVTRDVETNASLGSGQILVIGGLSAVADREAESGWPLLSKIPIIGNLFKATTKGKSRTNLAIFIHPTIVDPKLRAGMNKFTADSMQLTGKLFDDSHLFSGMRDPITRIFLGEPRTEAADELFEKYNRESASKPKPDSLDTIAIGTHDKSLQDFKERIKSAGKN